MSAPALSLSQGPLWTCTNCNTSNESQRRKCRGCNKWKSEVASSNRPRASYTVTSVAPPRKKSPIESTLWKCRKCGFDNFPQIFDCGSCKTKRPNWQWYEKQQGASAPSSDATPAAQIVPPMPPPKSKKPIDYRKTGVSDPRSNGKWRVDIAYKVSVVYSFVLPNPSPLAHLGNVRTETDTSVHSLL